MSKIIALCGWPKAGKSEVARIMCERFGAVIVDDGLILRQAVSVLFDGVDLTDCCSQAGKDRKVEVLGKEWTVRELLGHVGQVLEDFFGEFYVPDQTLKRIAKLPPAPIYVLPSIRKWQGHFYRGKGALVLEVARDVPESPHAFDRYDKTACHDVIDNHGSISDLEAEVARIMELEPPKTKIKWEATLRIKAPDYLPSFIAPQVS